MPSPDPDTRRCVSHGTEDMAEGTRTMRQQPDGTWVDLVPIGPKGPVAKVEFWLRARGWTRLSNLLGRIDERGL